MRILATVVIAFSFVSLAQAEMVVDFDSLPVDSSGYYNGNPSAGAPFRDNYTVIGTQPGLYGGTDYSQSWTAGGVQFNNEFNSMFQNWSGWSASNVQDATTAGYGNQYASFAGGGAGPAGETVPGGNYAVAFGNAMINLANNTSAVSMDITNTTYAGLSMQNGDSYAKQFGGESGNDADFFRVLVNGFDGLDGTGNQVGTVVVYLADFTFSDNSQDYILSDWLTVDLTSLADARSLVFSFESSDTGLYGMNTPAYFAMDNFTVASVPEPSMMVLLGTCAAAAGAFRWRKGRGKKSAVR